MTVGRIVDLSSNNHPGTAPIDWPQVKKAGVTTVLVKATQGVGYTNPWYARDLAGALGQGMDVLAYHFAAFGTVSCELVYFTEYGYVTIPTMALTAFAMIIVFFLCRKKNETI